MIMTRPLGGTEPRVDELPARFVGLSALWSSLGVASSGCKIASGPGRGAPASRPMPALRAGLVEGAAAVPSGTLARQELAWHRALFPASGGASTGFYI
jgi:hypothetical protein